MTEINSKFNQTQSVGPYAEVFAPIPQKELQEKLSDNLLAIAAALVGVSPRVDVKDFRYYAEAITYAKPVSRNDSQGSSNSLWDGLSEYVSEGVEQVEGFLASAADAASRAVDQLYQSAAAAFVAVVDKARETPAVDLQVSKIAPAQDSDTLSKSMASEVENKPAALVSGSSEAEVQTASIGALPNVSVVGAKAEIVFQPSQAQAALVTESKAAAVTTTAAPKFLLIPSAAMVSGAQSLVPGVSSSLASVVIDIVAPAVELSLATASVVAAPIAALTSSVSRVYSSSGAVTPMSKTSAAIADAGVVSVSQTTRTPSSPDIDLDEVLTRVITDITVRASNSDPKPLALGATISGLAVTIATQARAIDLASINSLIGEMKTFAQFIPSTAAQPRMARADVTSSRDLTTAVSEASEPVTIVAGKGGSQSSSNNSGGQQEQQLSEPEIQAADAEISGSGPESAILRDADVVAYS